MSKFMKIQQRQRVERAIEALQDLTKEDRAALSMAGFSMSDYHGSCYRYIIESLEKLSARIDADLR